MAESKAIEVLEDELLVHGKHATHLDPKRRKALFYDLEALMIRLGEIPKTPNMATEYDGTDYG